MTRAKRPTAPGGGVKIIKPERASRGALSSLSHPYPSSIHRALAGAYYRECACRLRNRISAERVAREPVGGFHFAPVETRLMYLYIRTYVCLQRAATLRLDFNTRYPDSENGCLPMVPEIAFSHGNCQCQVRGGGTGPPSFGIFSGTRLLSYLNIFGCGS